MLLDYQLVTCQLGLSTGVQKARVARWCYFFIFARFTSVDRKTALKPKEHGRTQ